jgi:hypothetical protein
VQPGPRLKKVLQHPPRTRLALTFLPLVGRIAETHHDRRLQREWPVQRVAFLDRQPICATECGRQLGAGDAGRADHRLQHAQSLRKSSRHVSRPRDGIRNHCQWVSAAACRGVHHLHARIGVRPAAAQPMLEQVPRQPHLGAHHFNRRVVHPECPTPLGRERADKLLVEEGQVHVGGVLAREKLCDHAPLNRGVNGIRIATFARIEHAPPHRAASGRE